MFRGKFLHVILRFSSRWIPRRATTFRRVGKFNRIPDLVVTTCPKPETALTQPPQHSWNRLPNELPSTAQLYLTPSQQGLTNGFLFAHSLDRDLQSEICKKKLDGRKVLKVYVALHLEKGEEEKVWSKKR